MLNGVTQLIMMKSDVLSGFDSIKLCTHYKYRGKVIDYVPYDVVNEPIEPVYETLAGWAEDLTGYNDLEQLPQAFLDYISYIENATGLPITILSVGPDRKQTMVREEVFK